MSRNHLPSMYDPEADRRIRETLALGAPKDPEPLPTPKPTPMELLQRWKLKAAASHTPANKKRNFGPSWIEEQRREREGLQ